MTIVFRIYLGSPSRNQKQNEFNINLIYKGFYRALIWIYDGVSITRDGDTPFGKAPMCRYSQRVTFQLNTFNYTNFRHIGSNVNPKISTLAFICENYFVKLWSELFILGGETDNFYRLICKGGRVIKAGEKQGQQGHRLKTPFCRGDKK